MSLVGVFLVLKSIVTAAVFRSFEAPGNCESIQLDMSLDQLAELHTNFLMEARRQNGTSYTPTVLMLVAGKQRYFKEHSQPNLLRKNGIFSHETGWGDLRRVSVQLQVAGNECGDETSI